MAQDKPCASYVVRLEFESWANHTELELRSRLQERSFRMCANPTSDAKGFTRVEYRICDALAINEVLCLVRKYVVRAGMECSVAIAKEFAEDCKADCTAQATDEQQQVLNAFLPSCHLPQQALPWHGEA